MYGFPPNIDLSFFCKQVLIQVCIGEHDLVLHFGNDVSIMASSSMGYIKPDGVTSDFTDFRKAASSLMTFISQTVVAAEGNENGTLKLIFEGEITLLLYDDSTEYESYVIKHGDKEIVV